MHFDRFCHRSISLKKVGQPVPDLFCHLLLSNVRIPLRCPQGTMTQMDLHHADVQWFLPENPPQERSGAPMPSCMTVELFNSSLGTDLVYYVVHGNRGLARCLK